MPARAPPADAAPRRRARRQGCGARRAARLRAVPAADRLQDRPEHAQRARARDALAAAVRASWRSSPALRFVWSLADRARGWRRARIAPPDQRPRVAALTTAFADWFTPFALGFVVVYPVLVIAARRLAGRAEMDRQFRHPDPDLRDARLGPEHRGRPRRPARSRLCRLLRGRRLFLRAARQELRPLVLDAAAARRHPRGVLGHPARLSGAAAARRLSRDRHARVRRDHPPGADQLGAGHQRLCRASAAFRARPSSAFRSTPTTTASRRRFGLGVHARSTARSFSTTSSSALALLTAYRDDRGCAGCRSGAPGRRCARTRSPAARSASTPPTPSSPPSPSARCSAASPARSSRRGRASSRPESFTFIESATDPRDRRARRHGQPDRRRHRGRS